MKFSRKLRVTFQFRRRPKKRKQNPALAKMGFHHKLVAGHFRNRASETLISHIDTVCARHNENSRAYREISATGLKFAEELLTRPNDFRLVERPLHVKSNHINQASNAHRLLVDIKTGVCVWTTIRLLGDSGFTMLSPLEPLVNNPIVDSINSDSIFRLNNDEIKHVLNPSQDETDPGVRLTVYIPRRVELALFVDIWNRAVVEAHKTAKQNNHGVNIGVLVDYQREQVDRKLGT